MPLTKLLALNVSGFAFIASSNEGIPPPAPPPELGVPGTELPGEALAGVATLMGFFAPAFGAGFDFVDNAASSSL